MAFNVHNIHVLENGGAIDPWSPPPPPPPPPPPVPQWSYQDAQSAGSMSDFGAPNVNVSVDTKSLDKFAQQLQELLDLLRPLVDSGAAPSGAVPGAVPAPAGGLLGGVDVQPGVFAEASAIRTVVNGADGNSGLKGQYTAVVVALGTVLADVQAGIKQMSAKYSSVEDLNKVSVTDLQGFFAQAQTDFAALGGATASTGSGSAGAAGG